MSRDRLGAHRHCRGDPRRGNRGIENVVSVLVLDRIIGRHLAFDSTRHDDRSLDREIDEGFENADSAAHASPSLVEIGIGIDADLALAVVTIARALQDCRAS